MSELGSAPTHGAARKSFFYQALKEAGVQFDKHYREYTADELERGYTALQVGLAQQGYQAASAPAPADDPAPAPASAPADDPVPTPAWLSGLAEPAPEPAAAAPEPPPAPEPAPSPAVRKPVEKPAAERQPAPPAPAAPQRPAPDPAELPGQRLNTQAEDEPIRVDDQGRVWYQEEVRKPSIPTPRARRVLKYIDRGAKVDKAIHGDYVETFEISGDGPGRPAEVKITLPSYQVGIYKDPRFPFRIHTYNGVSGFDLFEVQNYYGGAELVPAEVKRVYVENSLCYDIRTTVRAIQTEFRQLQLQGRA